MHLEATAVLLGLQDLGGKLTTGNHIGVILGPSLAILWVMLKLSRAMVGHAEAKCQMLCGLPQKHQGFKWACKLCWIHLGHIGPRLGPSLAILGSRYLELGHREVMLRLSWAMFCHVEVMYFRFCSAMLLVLHPEMPSSEQDQNFKWFLPAMLAPLGGQVWLSCGYVGTVGTTVASILGSPSAI